MKREPRQLTVRCGNEQCDYCYRDAPEPSKPYGEPLYPWQKEPHPAQRFPDTPHIPKATEKDPLAQRDTPGYKLDTGKLRYDLLPPDIVEAITWVLTWATERTNPPPYPDRNWEKGMSWMRVFAALMRHLWAWRRREDKDSESGRSHLWHAACCLTFLVTYERTHPELDDRCPTSNPNTALKS